ncbi:hypothetical protein, partial [Microbulbifer discodermiae]|uniref:hypothetical protein n=1 Tax=Microbulbifer sp. 2201CG32-9 TaxID=3232309 RepID=UPI00345BE001
SPGAAFENGAGCGLMSRTTDESGPVDKAIHSLNNAIAVDGYWELGEYLRTVTNPKATQKCILSALKLSSVIMPNSYFDVRERLAKHLAEV